MDIYSVFELSECCVKEEVFQLRQFQGYDHVVTMQMALFLKFQTSYICR